MLENTVHSSSPSLLFTLSHLACLILFLQGVYADEKEPMYRLWSINRFSTGRYYPSTVCFECACACVCVPYLLFLLDQVFCDTPGDLGMIAIEHKDTGSTLSTHTLHNISIIRTSIRCHLCNHEPQLEVCLNLRLWTTSIQKVQLFWPVFFLSL